MRHNNENLVEHLRAIACTIDAPCTVHVHEMEIDNRRVFAYQIVLNGNSCGPISNYNDISHVLLGIRMGINAMQAQA